MTKTIETLVEDIHAVLRGETEVPAATAKKLAKAFSKNMETFALDRVLKKSEHKPGLRMSNIGHPCIRKTWLSVKGPDLVEGYEKPGLLEPRAYSSFNFGDITEEYILLLAEAAGHKVEGRQDLMELEGVQGHRDAVIDGVLVDVKSASPFGFTKFVDGTLKDDDAFGYIGQIQTYLAAAQDDPLVTDKDRCAFLAFDKAKGTIHLDIHHKVDFDVAEVTKRIKAKMDSDELPDRAFEEVDDGYWKKHADGSREFIPNGNKKLCMNCSYCEERYNCWPYVEKWVRGRNIEYYTKIVKPFKGLHLETNGVPVEEEG